MTTNLKINIDLVNQEDRIGNETAFKQGEGKNTETDCFEKQITTERLTMNDMNDVPPHPTTHLAPWEAATFNAAQDYAEFGWPVFPAVIGPDGLKKSRKCASMCNGRRWGATLDTNEIMHDWAEWSDSMVGVVTGHKSNGGAGLVVLDIDTLEDHDVDGIGTLKELLKEMGKSLDDLPKTVEGVTPTGGQHLYYKYPESATPLKFKRHLARGVDIQSDKQIIIVPPSYRSDKDGHYSWVSSPTEREIAELPDWLLAVLLDAEKPSRPSERTEDGERVRRWDDGDGGHESAEDALRDTIARLTEAVPGERNDTLNRCAFVLGKYVPKGLLDEEEVRSRLMDAAKEIGLGEAEAAATINSGLTAGKKDPHQTQAHGTGHGTAAQSIRQTVDLSHDTLARDLGRHSFDHDARYVSPWGKWLFWSNSHWEKDAREVHATRTRDFLKMRAERLVDEARVEAGSLKEAEADALRKWARREARTLGNSSTISAVEKLARSNPQSATGAENFDKDTLLLGTPDGTVDLRTGQLRPAEREDLITKLTACGPAEVGTPPKLWLSFLDRIFAGDSDTIALMQRVAGYALTGLTTEHKLLFLYGGGRNGKGVFLNTLNQIWGDYSLNASADLFLTSTFQSHPTGLASLQGARLVIGSEIPRNTIWNEARLKDLTGGDRLSARFMRGNFFDFDPQFTLMFAGNDKPSLSGVDPAIRGRMVLVPFNVEIPRAEQDPHLKDKLVEEAPAILRWAIDGALEWQKRGLDVPDIIRAASEAYLDGEDHLKNFLAEKTVKDPKAVTKSVDLFNRFTAWCAREGVPSVPRRQFNTEMHASSWTEVRRSEGKIFIGLRLK